MSYRDKTKADIHDRMKQMKQDMEESRKRFFEERDPKWTSGASRIYRDFLDGDDGIMTRGRPFANLNTPWDEIHKRFEDQFRHPRRDEQSPEASGGEPPKKEEETAEHQEKPPEELGSLKKKLRNTVPDMHQTDSDEYDSDRGQRARSAPPNAPDLDQPFASRLDSNQHQEASGRQPVIRHIPIFVEGRDEPVISKEATSSQQFPKPPQPTQTQPPNQKPPPQPQQKVPPQQFTQKPQPQPFNQKPQPSQTFNQKPQPHQTAQEEATARSTPPPSAPTPPPPPPSASDPITKVQNIQKEVDLLRERVEAFSGNDRKDKEFLYLDEMLTRNLCNLDVIETEGREEVRAARKDAIRSIQRCINLLESKCPQTPAIEEKTDATKEDISVPQGETENGGAS